MTTTTEATIEADERLPLIRITRDFQATPAQLLRAHTDPEVFVRWNGPDDLGVEVLSWDARDGGEWSYVARQADQEYRFRGCFHEVGEGRIVQTFAFEGFPDSVALERLRFEDLGDGRTRLHAQSLFETFEARDGMLSSGMAVGVNEGYAKLDGVLAADG